MTRAYDPAYPLDPDQFDGDVTGLSKREHFAIVAMTGILTAGKPCALGYADALVVALWQPRP